MKAQNNNDSLLVSRVFNDFVSVTRKVNVYHPNEMDYSLSARYIVYRGEDTTRKWKDVCNYQNELEKINVDNVCLRLMKYLTPASDYKIVNYITEVQEEGQWHVLMVVFNSLSGTKEVAFAFLKIGDTFAIGDIDG
jgi:hypothetical protein